VSRDRRSEAGSTAGRAGRAVSPRHGEAPTAPAGPIAIVVESAAGHLRRVPFLPSRLPAALEPRGGRAAVVGNPLFDPMTSGYRAPMDDRESQFFFSVGRMCGDARTGGLTVRLTLASEEQVIGVPDPPPETEGPDELDTIGYADAVMVGGVEVALSDVVEAALAHPARRVDGG
jgi:hypothetical protein